MICKSFKELVAIVSIAAAKVRTFFKLPNFFERKFEKFFFKATGRSDISLSLANLIPSPGLPLLHYVDLRHSRSNAGANVELSMNSNKFFENFFLIFFSTLLLYYMVRIRDTKTKTISDTKDEQIELPVVSKMYLCAILN